MESMSQRNNFTTELISHKETIMWIRCLGSLKVYKFGLRIGGRGGGNGRGTLIIQVEEDKK
jgi:hypothetical protein